MTHICHIIPINDYGQRSKSHGQKKPLNQVKKEYQQFSEVTKVQSIVITIKIDKNEMYSIITYCIINYNSYYIINMREPIRFLS